MIDDLLLCVHPDLHMRAPRTAVDIDWGYTHTHTHFFLFVCRFFSFLFSFFLENVQTSCSVDLIDKLLAPHRQGRAALAT